MAYRNNTEFAKSGGLLLPTNISRAQDLERVLKAGEILLHPGAPVIGAFVVLTGALKVKRHYKAGAFLERVLGPGEAYGFQEARSGCVGETTLVAAANTVVRLVAPSDMDAWGRAEDIASATSWKSALKRPLDLLPVRARVAATVWFLGAKFGRRAAEDGSIHIDLDLTREELAHLAGTVYESVIRNLTQLKSDGIIALSGRHIQILSEDQLARVGQLVLESIAYDQNTIFKKRSSSGHSSPFDGDPKKAI
ncbi:MAG: Crp/Fnr family transcriptional regulator [Bdellovibrionales bacterium]|nr:Crp/Fnr family transcriptional regulator [Bdellovibrionales bacterium]